MPLPKSLLFPGLTSSIKIDPNVVHAGEVALADLSAERFEPPEAGVIVTAPRALLEKIKRAQPKIEVDRTRLKLAMQKPVIAENRSLALLGGISESYKKESQKFSINQ